MLIISVTKATTCCFQYFPDSLMYRGQLLVVYWRLVRVTLVVA